MYSGPAQFPEVESIEKDVTIAHLDLSLKCPSFVRFPFYMGSCTSEFGEIQIRGKTPTPDKWEEGTTHRWIVLIADLKTWCDITDTMLAVSLSRNSS